MFSSIIRRSLVASSRVIGVPSTAILRLAAVRRGTNSARLLLPSVRCATTATTSSAAGGGRSSTRASHAGGHPAAQDGKPPSAAAQKKDAGAPNASAAAHTASHDKQREAHPPASSGPAAAARRRRQRQPHAARPAGPAPVKKVRKTKKRSPIKKRQGGSRTSSASITTGTAASAAATRPRQAKVPKSNSGAGAKKRTRRQKIRVCVLNSSYEGAGSETELMDNYWCTPQHYTKKNKPNYTFTDVSVLKMDSYRTIRELVTSQRFDVFFNLCDGGRDERRAGVDVVEALEEMNAAYTGTDSRSFEPSKIDMKLMVGSSGVRVPNFVLLENDEGLAKKCRHLRFPVIVKHLSGYASVGIQKDNRCNNLDELRAKVKTFVKQYNHAMVEEFIRGREGTVLTCADSQSPFGVKVFRPLMFDFLQGADDFAYFDKKWTSECDATAYGFLPNTDPAYSSIIEMARNAYTYIMNGVGYGRVDFRIDVVTGEPYFLEINPNCGMWYSEKDGGDFADVMVQGDATWDHEKFISNAISRALKEQAARKPWYFISHDKNGLFSTRASKTVAAGKCLFGDAVHPIPVVAKALYKLGAEDPSVGCIICRADGIHHAVAMRHSCEPNMHFVHGRTLLFAAKRQISVGEELTVDYATLRDENMPRFACSCGTKNCRSVIFAMPALPRTVEMKAMKRLLREKQRVWLREKADREAEKIIKKRSVGVTSGTAASTGALVTTSSSSKSSNLPRE